MGEKYNKISPLLFAVDQMQLESVGDKYLDVYFMYKYFEEEHRGVTYYVAFWREKKKKNTVKSNPPEECHF